MIKSVVVWRITQMYTGQALAADGVTTITLQAGNFIHCVLNDATHTLTSKYSSSSSDDTGQLIKSGPNIYIDPTGASELFSPQPLYQYCEGTTLHAVGTSNNYPYGTLSTNANSPICTIGGVCDLIIDTDAVITPVSSPGASDGSIIGGASSNNGLIKFSFDQNFPYGAAHPGTTLDPLNLWEVFNNSSEPIVWTTGIPQPYCTVTPPTIYTPVLSDIIRMKYSAAWVANTWYTFNYSFRCVSQNSNYRLIYIRCFNEFMVPINALFNQEKTAYGYGSPGGNEGGTLAGQWLMQMPADVRYIGIQVDLGIGQVIGTDVTTILDFSEVVVSDPANVKTELRFENLMTGTYTVYAKDAGGCQDSFTFFVPITIVNNIRYRLQFKDFLKVSGRYHRLDISERAYTGPIEDVCGGSQPILISYVGDANDHSKPLLASNMQIQLMCFIPEQFSAIPLGDDRKYLVEYRTDINEAFTSPTFYWKGYVVPEFSSEPYMAAPYEFTLTASDQIGELKNLPFVNDAGNNYRGEMNMIAILVEVLRRCDLSLPVRCGVNVWADIMNQSGDPLSQAMIDMRIFDGKNCEYVLQELAKPFRAQIFQSMGYWWIIRLSDAVGNFEYREFTAEGIFSSFGSFNSYIELGSPNKVRNTGAMFADRRQLLSRSRNYGTFTITHDLKKDGNLIDTGAFEEEDIELLSDGHAGFKDWSITIGQAGVTFGMEHVDNGTSKGAAFFDFSQVTNNQSDTVFYSKRIPYDLDAGGKIRLKFQYKVSPKYSINYARIAWGLKLIPHEADGSDGAPWWLGQSGAGVYTIYETEQRNGIYTTAFDSFQTFDVLFALQGVFGLNAVQIYFWFHDHHGRDVKNITELRAYIPHQRGMKVMMTNGKEPDGITDKPESNVYVADYSYEADNPPDIVRPNNYATGGSSEFMLLWKKETLMGPIRINAGLINRINFDNVVLATYPAEPYNAQIIDPPETLDYLQTVAAFYKSQFHMDVLIGDMLRIDERPDRTRYKNERYIYRSYIRLADGTPTLYWHRLGVSESKRLLQITIEDYVAQFSKPQRKLSGVLVSSQIIHFINCIRDNEDAARTRYRPMTFEFDVKTAAYTMDLGAVDAGPEGQPVVKGQYHKQQYDQSHFIGS